MNPEKSIRSIMTTDLVTVRPDTNAKEVYDIFKKHPFHHLPVVTTGEALAGIISKEDFFRVSYLLSNQTSGKNWTEKQYQSLKAKDFMTVFPMTLDPEDTIGLAADIFLANQFHALPVVEDHRLIGLVTTHDLLSFAFALSKTEGDMPEEAYRNRDAEDEFLDGSEFKDDDNYLF